VGRRQRYTVEGLAGHLARAVLTVDGYLDAVDPSPGVDEVERGEDDRSELTNVAGYLVAGSATRTRCTAT
jgi:hypothetical protein